MKKVYMLFLLALTAIGVSAQRLDFKFKDGKQSSLWNSLPTKEIGKITHSVDAEGNGVVSVKMKSGPTLVYGTDSISNFTANPPTQDLSLEQNGTLLRIIDEYDYDDDTLFVDDVYPKVGTYEYFNKVVRGLCTLLPYRDDYNNPYTIRYHVYDFAYVSTDYDGAKIELSGRVVFPYNYGDDRQLSINTVFLENHYTTFKNQQSPSSSFENQQLTGMACKGYLVVQPDYLGFGVSKQRSQLFVDQNLMSRHVVDCLLAAMELKDMVNSDPTLVDIPLKSNATLLNEGVSQGASSALGVHRFIENNLTNKEFSKLPYLTETRVCAGPYSPMITMEEYCKWDSLDYCPTVPMLMQAAVINHADLMVDEEGNPISVNDLFCDKMTTERYPEYGNLSLWEMITSKLYDSYDLRSALWKTYGCGNSCASVRTMLNPEIQTDGVLHYDHPYVKAIQKVFALSDNTTGWAPEAKLSLWHGQHDYFVPYKNSTAFVENMMANYPNANYSFTTINDEGVGDHTKVCGVWMLAELLGTDVNDLIITLKENGYLGE